MNDVSYARPRLNSDGEALEIGYREGCSIRENGGKPSDLNDQREINFEIPFPSLRGPANPHYGSWRRGFDAGYLGQLKPSRS